ncbi:S1 family peptidase [Methylobacterium sp.]|uniref:S1 family peptidase n=1 Tax=Methylobacterium sp. TaxID=409 RepID=UPI003C716B6F
MPGSTDAVEEGSGFLVSNEGHIVTAKHVVQAAIESGATVTVSLRYKSNAQTPALLSGCDGKGKYPDACIIRISEDVVKGEKVSAVEGIGCRKINLSEDLVGYGYAFGKHNTLFAVPGKFIGGLGEFDLYPTNLAFTYGMSGGPVVDTENNVVGVVAGGVKGGTHGYFTPISQVAAKLLDANVICKSGESGSKVIPDGSYSLSMIKTAELQLLGVDDVMSVTVNDAPVEKATFGKPSPWRDIKPFLTKGPNGILVEIWNGAYGGCGGALQVRINGKMLPELSKKWYLDGAVAPYKGTCVTELFTLNLDD